MNSHPNYELFEEIGRTETTVVYRAHDLALGRDVAIKELTAAGKSDLQRQERLIREAQFLAQTTHAGILRVHTVVVENGWIVMELMKGNLAAQIRHEALPPETVRSILRQLLSALAFLHQQGKLHGAIRPSNILIDAAGSVRLSDFEQTDVEGELRAPTSTKKYLAPEWIRSEFGPLGPPSDLYCLAFTALELLAGPQFDSLMLNAQAVSVDPEVAWLRRHSSADPLPKVAQLLPAVPADLANTLDACLEKQVQDRPSSAAEVLEKLDDQAIVRVHPVSPEPTAAQDAGSEIMPAQVRQINPLAVESAPSGAGKSSTSRLPHKSTAGKAAGTKHPTTTRDDLNRTLEKPYVLYPLCTLILLGALGVGLMMRAKKNDQPPAPLAKSGPVVPTPDLPPTAAESTGEETQSTGEETDQRPEEVPTTDVEKTDSADVPDPQTEDELSSEEDSDLGAEQPESLPPSEEMQVDATLEKADPRVTIEDAAQDSEGEDGEQMPESIDETQPPDLLLELVSKDVEIDTSALLNEFKGNPELVIDADGFLAEVTDVAIDPQGRWVAASGDKVVRLWDLQSGRLVRTLRGDRSPTSYGNCLTLAFSPDGEHLVVGVGDYQPHGSIRVYRTDSFDEIEALLPGHTSPVRQLAFSRDGQQMVSADADGHVAIWDWPKRRMLEKVPPRDVQAPIIDELHFAGDEPVVFGIDYAGPFLLDAPKLRRLSAADPLPSRLHAWMIDLLSGNLVYPFETASDPRVVDLQLDHDLWAAAGVGREANRSTFWIGLWPARRLDADPASEPQRTYTGHRWQVTAVDLEPQLGLAASADKFGEVHVWRIDSGERLHRLHPQGRSIYEAVFDKQSSRIGFGTTPFSADRWARNQFGAVDKVLDLEKRSIYTVDPEQELEPIQEKASDGTNRLEIKRPGDGTRFSVQRQSDGGTAARYEFTAGRNPTVFSLLDHSVLDVQQPVLIGDNGGLLAVWNSDSDRLKRAFIGHEGMITGISVAPHGKLLLSGSTDRTIRIWSLQDPTSTGTFDFKYENAVVTSVAPGSSSAQAGVAVGDRIETIDGKSMKEMYELMLAGQFNYRPGQSVPVEMSHQGKPYQFEMRLDEGYDFAEPILSVYIGDQDRWIVWTPRGYYDASPGAEELIGWHVNRGPEKSARYFPVGQFRESLYRPDIIDRILHGENVDEAIEAANRAREQAAELDLRSPSDLALHYPPQIEILAPSAAVPQRQSEALIEATVTSLNGVPISEVSVLVNGIGVATTPPASASATEMKVRQNIELDEGTNRIELIATNAYARGIKAIEIDVETDRREQEQSGKGDLRILAVGVVASNHPRPDSKRLRAANDARVFADMLATQEGGRLYESVSQRVLANDLATRSAILDGFQWLVDQTQPGDTVAIYIAAEGFVDSSENFYIGAHDVDLNRPRATAVSWREFIQTLQTDLPACRRLVFLDLEPSDESLAPGMRNPLLDLATPEMGTVFFSSSALQQETSSPTDQDQSFLTRALQLAIADPDADVMPSPPDGLLSCEEATTAWMEKVRRLSQGKLYPIAFAPQASRKINVFQLSSP